MVALNNGHYVVSSYYWDNLQTSDAGAVTWRNGNGTGTGVVAADNSLVGTLTLDSIGSGGITALTNGNYVVGSSEVNLGTNPPIPSVGASTWCSGTGVTSAVVSTTNSFVGLSPNDKVSRGGVVALSNGNYVVNSPDWDGMGTENAGAETWGIGNAPTGAFVGSGNSLVGNYNQQRFGDGYSTVATSDGSYIVYSPRTDVFDADVGMISFGTRDGATVGPIPSPIYVLGATLGGGFRMVFDYDAVRERLLVGLPADNRVELVSTNPNLLFRSGFE